MADTDLTRGPDDMDLPDQPGMTDAELAAEELGLDEAYADVEVETMNASATAIGSVTTVDLVATQSAIGSASVGGDADISMSCVGAVSAGSAGVYQGVAGAVLSEGEAAVDQAFVPLVVARATDMESAVACTVITGEASVAHSWVGMMAARNATISDDSRVIIDTKAALIIGGFLFGGLGLVALAMFLSARRIADRIPRLPWSKGNVPHLPHLQMPDLSKLADMPQVGALLARMRAS